MLVPTGEIDPDTGKPVMREVTKEDLWKDSRFKVEGGMPSKFAEAVWNKLDRKGEIDGEGLDSSSSSGQSFSKTSNESVDISSNPSNQPDQKGPEQSVNEKPDHHQPPSSESTTKSYARNTRFLSRTSSRYCN